MHFIFIAQCNRGCFNGGYCAAPETCVCNNGWGGIDCTEGLLSFKLSTYIVQSIIMKLRMYLNSANYCLFDDTKTMRHLTH